MSTVYSVLGEQVRTPVEVRVADACSAILFADPAAVRKTLSGTGLRPVEIAGRAFCALAFVRYLDSDLGRYREFAVAPLVREPGRGVGAYIHWLPVNEHFTCAAGRQIWGFPKEMTDIEITAVPGGKRCSVSIDGHLVISVRVAGGLPVPPGLGGSAVDAYTIRDGVQRRTPWVMRPSRVRMRPGGVAIEYGDHPIATELRALGLSRRALFGSRIGLLRMTFEDASIVG